MRPSEQTGPSGVSSRGEPIQLTLIRHTAVAVPRGICYGQSDVGLAASFAAESEAVRQAIAAATFDRVYTSPLTRCTRLAAAIGHAQAISVDDNLRELHFGDWEMADWDSIYASPQGKAWFADYVTTRCPNGEAFTDLIARMRVFVRLLQAAGQRRVAAFTHAGNLRAAMCLFTGRSPQEAFTIPVAYGQILTFRLENDESAAS